MLSDHARWFIFSLILAIIGSLVIVKSCNGQELYLNLNNISGAKLNNFYINTSMVKQFLLYDKIKTGSINVQNWSIPRATILEEGETVYPFVVNQLDNKSIIGGGQRIEIFKGFKVPYYVYYPEVQSNISGDELELDDRFLWLCLVIAKNYNANIFIGDKVINQSAYITDDYSLLSLVKANFGFKNKNNYWLNRNVILYPKDVNHTWDSTMSFQFNNKMFVIEEIPRRKF